MLQRRLRMGIFGVGRMGMVHLENLLALARQGQIELVALGDRHRPTLEAAQAYLAQKSPAGELPRTFDSAAHMAGEARLDAVLVASRTEHHAVDSRAFTDRKIPVLIEKPLAGSVAEAADYCEHLGSSGERLVQIAFQRHYDPAAQIASQWLAGGEIGRLQQSHHVLQDKNPTPANYQSSGITADMAIHLIFEAMSFHDFELPHRVQALRFLAPHYEDRANEGANVVHAFCSWSDGSVAHLWGSRINNTGYDNGFKLIGTKGRIDVGEFVGDFGDVTVKMWQGTDDGTTPRGRLIRSLSFPMASSTTPQPDFFARYGKAYACELEAFIDTARRGEAFAPGPSIGWKTQLVAELAEASSRANGRLFELRTAEGRPLQSAEDARRYFAGLEPIPISKVEASSLRP